uniref:Odorant-binding protein 2 n=1 Tax=Batocera horsfieldi TaxID=351105 RepID=U6BG07_9CUCU|nr:odorant-binding protein 2 [Batocera horsfieldi]
MSLRIVIALFSLASVAYAKLQLPVELQEYADGLHDLCIKKTGITEDDHIAYDIANNPHDEKLQCYIKCLMLEANWMDKDGTIQYAWIEENLHQDVKDIVITALSKCKNINEGANLCEKASHFNACMYEADKENWFLV